MVATMGIVTVVGLVVGLAPFVSWPHLARAHTGADAALSGLTLSTGRLSPTFARGMTLNTALVGYTVTRTEEDTSLSPPASDPVASFPSTAVYTVTFDGDWTTAGTPGGVPSGAHFSRLVGAVHNAGVTFVESGETASAGIESMAEIGGTSTLKGEVRAEIDGSAGDAFSVLEGDTDFISPTTSKTLTATLTTAHPRVTLVTMVAPSPDWFVGVSGLPLLNPQGRWLRSHTVNLYPWDAGTEDGTEFSLSNDATDPQETIQSIRGTGKFSTERIATLSFTLQSVSATRSVAENTAAGTDIGAPVAATDTSGAVTYTLAGTDAASFDIDTSTGQLQTKAALDYETKASYEVTVTATDSDGSAVTTVTITVTDEENAGTVSLFPAQPRVNTVVSARLSDPDGVELGSVSWQWDRSSDKSNWDTIRDFGRQQRADGTLSDRGPDPNYAPTDDDRGMYLRATATYNDGEGSGKTAQVVSDNVVGDRAPAPKLSVTTLISGVSIPWDMAFTPDGTMLFTRRSGVMSSRLTNGTVQAVTADLADLYASGEAGLMAIVVDPGFTSSRRFYTCQNHTGSELQVIAWTINADYTTAIRVADPLVGDIPAANYHSGCRLRFGPDGYLWIATGDARTGTVPQDLTSLGGKILRVNASTGTAAPGNPFTSSRVYTYGHRNLQGLALRPGTQQMWSVEHGPTVDDEINLLTSGGNYGWDPVPDYNQAVPMTDLVKFPDAIEAKWSSGTRTLATSGGIFLDGDDWDEWEGRLVVATLQTQSLRVFEFTNDGTFVSQVVVPELGETYGRLRTPMLGPDGALYVTTSNGGGRDRILRVTPHQAPEFPAETDTQEAAENAEISTVVATVEASDFNYDTLTYTLSGTDAASFTIANDAVGELRANEPLDYETKRSYQVVVTATDPSGLSDNITLTIEVTDEDDAGAVELSLLQPQVETRLTATLTDPDGSVSGVTWMWERSLSRTSGWAVINGATLASYTPVADDAEPSRYYLRVTASYTDGEGSGKGKEAISLNRVQPKPTIPNRPPEFPSTETGAREVTENRVADRNVGAPVSASDADNDTLTYTLDGTDAASFDIVRETGQLRTKAALNYETKTSYSVTVTATDPSNEADTIDVTITVTDVNEPPAFPSTETSRSVSETTETGGNVGAPVAASDPDRSDMPTYTLGGADAGAFSIDAMTGQITVGAGTTLDRSSKPTYSVTVSAHDGKDDRGNPDTTTDDTTTVTITVTEVAPPPPPRRRSRGGGGRSSSSGSVVFTDGAIVARSVAENTVPDPTDADADKVGAPVVATDANNNPLTYSLGGSNAALFTIDADTGQIRVGAGTALDYETKSSYAVSVIATSSSGGSARITVIILVTDVDWGPYDADSNEVIDRDEVLAAVADYNNDLISKEEMLEVIKLYFST